MPSSIPRDGGRIIRCKICLERGLVYSLKNLGDGRMECPNCHRIVQIKGSKPVKLRCADPVRFRTRNAGGARGGEQSSSWYKPVEFTPPREVKKEKISFTQPEPDVFDQKEDFLVVAEFPGHSKEQIEWQVEDKTLLIRSKIRNISYEIPVPAEELETMNPEMNVKNGIFQIRFKKRAN